MLFTLFMLSPKSREKRVLQIWMPSIWLGWMVLSQLHEIKISQGKGKKLASLIPNENNVEQTATVEQ